jgi:hypothetical protein
MKSRCQCYLQGSRTLNRIDLQPDATPPYLTDMPATAPTSDIPGSGYAGLRQSLHRRQKTLDSAQKSLSRLAPCRRPLNKRSISTLETLCAACSFSQQLNLLGLEQPTVHLLYSLNSSFNRASSSKICIDIKISGRILPHPKGQQPLRLDNGL